MADLKGKVAIVAGASRGVGRAYALALAEAGAHVVAWARTTDGDPTKPGNLAELAATAKAASGGLSPFACDVSNGTQVAERTQQAVADHGGLDILLINAIWPIRGFDALGVSTQEWLDTFRMNLLAPYAIMREAVPHMIARGGGSIIAMTTASAQASRPGETTHGYPAYCITKAGLERMVTYFAAEFADRNIAVNAISPGNVARYMQSGREPHLGFWGAPIVHLAGERGRGGLTGQILHTYQFGRAWGPRLSPPPRGDELVDALLKDSGIED